MIRLLLIVTIAFAMVTLPAPLPASAQDTPGCEGLSAYQTDLAALRTANEADIAAVANLRSADIATLTPADWQTVADASNRVATALGTVTPPPWAALWHSFKTGLYTYVATSAPDVATAPEGVLTSFKQTLKVEADLINLVNSRCAGFGAVAAEWPNPFAVPVIDRTDADVSSGCWTAADRVAAEGMPLNWGRVPTTIIDPAKSYTATFETSLGAFTVELYPADAPIAVNSFVCLATAGYFDATLFHRIIDGFVIQGGDPTATGTGGPGYEFADETVTRDYEVGTLAMANAGPNTNGSQFFVCLDNLTEMGALPKNYTIFGKVIEGLDVISAIGSTPVKASDFGEMSSPIEPVVLISVVITTS